MYFIPSTVDTVKKILDFPENVIIVYSFKSSTIHSFKTISRLMLLLPLTFSIFLIVGGSILGLQFISVILAGIQASELKKSLVRSIILRKSMVFKFTTNACFIHPIFPYHHRLAIIHTIPCLPIAHQVSSL